VALAEGIEILGLVVRYPVYPAAPQHSDPLERQSSDGGVVRSTAGSETLVERLGPERLRDRLGRPLHERLSHEGGACPAPVLISFLVAFGSSQPSDS